MFKKKVKLAMGLKLFRLFLTAALLSGAIVGGVKLQIVSSSKSALQTKIAANFGFSPSLLVEVVDADGTRVTTGANSTLSVYAELSDTSLCLSADSMFDLKDGVGMFPGSVCEPTLPGVNVTLTFKCNVAYVNDSDATNPFVVTDEIWLAYFAKDDRYRNGYVEQFLRDGVRDVNFGHMDDPVRHVFPNRTLHLKSYYHGDGNIGENFNLWKSVQTFNMKYPSKKAHGIIGFSNNEISKILLPLATTDGIAVTSFRDDISKDFGDTVKYPYFNRIHYPENLLEYAFTLYLKERKWTKIIILSGFDSKLNKEFYQWSTDHGIEIVKEYTVPTIANADDEPVGGFLNIINDIKKSGIHLIVNTVRGEASTYLYTEAQDFGISSVNGYQWVGYRNSKYFPKGNYPMRCRKEGELCNFKFKGATFFDAAYLVDGWTTIEWLGILGKYYDQDIEKSLGHYREFPKNDVFKTGPEYGLIYDVLKTNIYAMENIMKRNETITGKTLAKEIRENTDFYGLTQRVQLDSTTGIRQNFIGYASVNWPNKDFFNAEHVIELLSGRLEKWDYSNLDILSVNTLFEMDGIGSAQITEMKADGGPQSRRRIHLFNDADSVTGYISVDNKFKNKRTFKKYKGLFGFEFQKQIKNNFDSKVPDEIIPLEVEDDVEYVPAPYYCVNGCGGNVTDPSDINVYDNGQCIHHGLCKCNVGPNEEKLWDGPTCAVAQCPDGCDKGSCDAPSTCVCMTGWSGVSCSSAVCSSCSAGGDCISPEVCVCKTGQYGASCGSKCTCVNGICNDGQSGDGTCKSCNSGYVGANCDISLVALLIPTIIGVVLLSVCLYMLAQYFIAQTRLKAALYNNDWIVNWSDVKKHDENTGKSSMFISAMSMNNNKRKERKQINTGTWDGMDIHYQTLEKDSIALTDAVRLEVKEMRDMRHQNIALFVGSCIDYPNVAILTEMQPKGSLDDVLTNEDIKLPWNFRFAILKGITAGLEYIHRSEIKSHGRLKSSNCLIDNRWTVKISGFGLHNLKAHQRNVGIFNPHDKFSVDESRSNYGSLLWTAPEILHTGVYHLDHVGRGTVEGDMYSLAMIMSEMCTRDYPFADIMLEKSEIVHLLTGKKDEVIQRVWNDYIAKLNIEQGGYVRPCIKDKEWPGKYEKRKAFKKLMESCWHEDPVHRPTLRECKASLEIVEPQRGELMDHLVTMLEKYSSNLEDIVVKRTKQLTKEKQKTEDLVSRLLPKSVAEDLKQGKRVEPENFDHVTIYFSDIVGFTNIARASTPLEVVALLNDMYTAFDSISANYDVYKVETIGDAYMIVSGLPTRNGDQHAGEVCTTAMDLLHAIESFQIRHMKSTKLQLRIGIHTGTVVAGVVGLKMPRYCLFGDSVKVAESMESGGAPMRIQVSGTTYEILQRLGGYKCDYRDEVDVKGHGILKRYWLRGKVGYERELPEVV